MKISHVLSTRPLSKSIELAELLKPLGLVTVIQPAFEYLARDLTVHQAGDLAALSKAGSDALVIFTSPRAVWFGLKQLPADALWQARKAAVGAATAHALKKAGVRVDVVPVRGYSSEALLQAIESTQVSYSQVFIVAAPGGRTKLFESLSAHCDSVRMLMAYQSEPAEIDRAALAELGEASGLLTVWTSGNAMRSLSQRLPPATWFQICESEWLVISERLLRLSRAFGPAKVRVSDGPGNTDLMTSIRSLV